MPRQVIKDETPLHRKLGYEHAVERARIREHLIRRGWSPSDLAFEFRITRIQDRIHKHKPTMRERQQAWLAKQPQPKPSVIFTPEELAFLVEHFEGANHPLAQSIYAKASA